MTDTVLVAPRALPRTKLAPRADWLLAALIVGPLLVMIGRLAPLPTSELFSAFLSVDHLPEKARHVVSSIFFVPIGAMLVVAFRRTLGLKVLGFFRPILIAMAFASTGILLGTACLVLFLSFVAGVRPLLAGTPYNTRIPVLLSLVAAMLALLLMTGAWWQAPWLERAAYFPVIALCLACESFARVLERDGLAEAGWQTVTTLLCAVAIAAIAAWPGFMQFMMHMPELLFLEAGAILLLARHLSFRLLEGWNPLVRRQPALGTANENETADRRHFDD